MKPFRIIKDFRYFESQETGENVILITRKHWLKLSVPFVATGLVGLLLIIFFRMSFLQEATLFGAFDPTGIASFEAILTMYLVLAAFGGWLMRYLNVLILTNKHIVDVSQKAFFARSVSTLSLESIEDVSIDKNGILASLLDYGNIKIQTAGELPNFELKSIADPETVQRTIMEAKEDFKK